MFHPRGPNFFLSWIVAWKKQRPKVILRHLIPRTVIKIKPLSCYAKIYIMERENMIQNYDNWVRLKKQKSLLWSKCFCQKNNCFLHKIILFIKTTWILQLYTSKNVSCIPMCFSTMVRHNAHLVNPVSYLLWSSKDPGVISENALRTLARSPLGGSLVTLTLFCSTDTGNFVVGMELRYKRKSSWISAPGSPMVLMSSSIANIHEAAKWQF